MYKIKRGELFSGRKGHGNGERNKKNLLFFRFSRKLDIENKNLSACSIKSNHAGLNLEKSIADRTLQC